MNFKKFTFLSKSPAFSPTARQQFFPPADPQNRPKWAIPPASGHPDWTGCVGIPSKKYCFGFGATITDAGVHGSFQFSSLPTETT